MNIDRLITMANDIAAFFDAEGEAEAAGSIAAHLQKFWEPRMRAQIIAHEQAGGAGLRQSVRAAVRLLPPPARGGAA